MKPNQIYHYAIISKAIAYLDLHFKEQPTLNEIAESVHLSPFHFQRLFTEWVGVSPKKYLQYLNSTYSKKMLKNSSVSVLEASLNSGLSSASRLHDLFVKIEGMTPGIYKNGGENLDIYYSFSESMFGNILIASTSLGICHLAFIDNKDIGLKVLMKEFPSANYKEENHKFHKEVLKIFKGNWSEPSQLKLHLKGSPFQLKVWEALLKIPEGKLTTYKAIANSIGNSNASRAVGTAIGNNPIAFLIPCHRVIQASGQIGGYRWAPIRKRMMIGWELAKYESHESL